MRLLELFSGTGSVGKPWRAAGHEVISVDVDGRFGASIVEDILQLSYCKLPTPDVIWCSPPCDQCARCRTRAKKDRNLVLADSLVANAMEIIAYFQKLNVSVPVVFCLKCFTILDQMLPYFHDFSPKSVQN